LKQLKGATLTGEGSQNLAGYVNIDVRNSCKSVDARNIQKSRTASCAVFCVRGQQQQQQQQQQQHCRFT
jgi:hypothetical protein